MRYFSYITSVISPFNIILSPIGKLYFTTEFKKLLEKYSNYNLEKLKERLEVSYQYAKEENDLEIPSLHLYSYILQWNLEAFKDSLRFYIFDPSLAGLIQQLKGIFDWSMGLGWLTWATTSEYIQKYVTEPLQQALSEKLRDKEVSKSDIEDFVRYLIVNVRDYELWLKKQGYSDDYIKAMKLRLAYELINSKLKDLIHYGILDIVYVKKVLKDLGINDNDADKLILTIYKLPSENKILDWLKDKAIDENTAMQYLIYHGYTPELANFIIKRESEREITDDKHLSKSELLRLYKYNIINEDELRQYLKQLGYSIDAIELLIELANREKRNREREISYSVIHRMYINDVIERQEAYSYLSELGYSDKDIELILQLWDKEKEKKPLRFNKSTVLRAYRYDVIDRQTAEEYLKQLGYDKESIKLMLDVVDKQKEKEPKKPSLHLILQYLSYKIIKPNDAIELLKNIGYSEEDAKRIVELWKRRQLGTKVNLTTSQILRAYKYGVIKEDVADYLLQLKGYSDWEREILLSLYKPKS